MRLRSGSRANQVVASNSPGTFGIDCVRIPRSPKVVLLPEMDTLTPTATLVSHAGEPFVTLGFPIAAGRTRQKIDLGQILHHLVTELDRRIDP